MLGRHRRRQQAHGAVELNVIPLIDVVFFLLVFYVISTSFVQETGVPIERPGSSQATQVQAGFVAVAVTKAGAVFVGPLPVELPQLAEAVRGALATAQSSRVLVMADRELATGLLLRVMDACRAGGATAVDVAANTDGG